MKDISYNGWSNYATWRINLEYGFNDDMELYEGLDNELEPTVDFIQNMVEDHLECNCENETTLSYANAFIDDVDWYEIAIDIMENRNEKV